MEYIGGEIIGQRVQSSESFRHFEARQKVLQSIYDLFSSAIAFQTALGPYIASEKY